MGFSSVSVVKKKKKKSACNAGDVGSIPGSGRSPAEENGNPLQYSKWQPTPNLPEKSHRQRSLAGYSPWGCITIRHDLATKQQQQPPQTLNNY